MKRKTSILRQFMFSIVVVGTCAAWAQELPHSQNERDPDYLQSTYGNQLEIPNQGGVVAVTSIHPDHSRKKMNNFQHASQAAWHVTKGSEEPQNTLGEWSQTDGFITTRRIPVSSNGSVLFALVATGEIISVYFKGSMDTGKEDIDAADASFELVDFARAISWTVNGSDLGWSGKGSFGPTMSDVTHLFDGPLESEDSIFNYWETLNHSPGVGQIGGTAHSGGHFYLTIRHPSPVALMAEYTSEGPGPFGGYTQLRGYSHTASPSSALSYLYDENLGYWAEQPGRECHTGEVNPTNFYLGIFNLTDSDVESCQFQASWDLQSHPCSQGILDVLNDPTNSPTLLIRTEDFVYVPTPDCSQFTPTQQHVLPGETHWMWVEFVVNGVTYPRKINFVKQ